MIKVHQNRRLSRKIFYGLKFNGFLKSFGIRRDIVKTLHELDMEMELEIYELTVDLPKKIKRSTQIISITNSHFLSTESYRIVKRNLYFNNQEDLNLFLLSI